MNPKRLLRLFRSGIDTLSLAGKFGIHESEVVRALHFARNYERWEKKTGTRR